MHAKPSQKLHTTQLRGFHFGIILRIFVQKRNAILVNVQNMCIANSHTVRVLRQVTHYLFGIAKRRFAVHHPCNSLPRKVALNCSTGYR